MLETLNEAQWLNRLKERPIGTRAAYRAMYSSWWEGIVTDPALMLTPVDDHQVHRGDAVFEAIKCRQNKIYLADEHLRRLEKSSQSIHLDHAYTLGALREILREVMRASKLEDALLRVFLSRGPGSFSCNPYDTFGTQLIVVATELAQPSELVFKNGVSLGLSQIPAKEPWQARIKSCNYLPNVLMKREAVDRRMDFVVSFDARENLTEGSTENLILVDASGVLVRPRWQGILAGTMMLRAFELVGPLIEEGLLAGAVERDLSLADLLSAREVMMAGTTMDVLSVCRYEGKPIAGGRPGPVSQRLREALVADQKGSAKTLSV